MSEGAMVNSPAFVVAKPTSPTTKYITRYEGVVHISRSRIAMAFLIEASVEVVCPKKLKEMLFTINT